MATGATTSSSYRIPIGHRIEEILDERGAAYLIGFFANRIQFDPRRLVAILQGEITPTSSDLEQIAKGLGLSVERLTQQDTLEQTEHLHLQLQSPGVSEDVVQLARELASVAQGATERSDAFTNLGKAYFRCRRLEDAHEAFVQAYTHYKPVMDRHRDFDRLLRLFNNLIFSYNKQKDYQGLAEILDQAESIEWQDPEQKGAVFFASAVVQYELGNVEQAKQRFQQSLHAYLNSENTVLIGRGYYNLGRLEYLIGQDALAVDYLETALQYLNTDQKTSTKVVEYLVKALIQLHELERAEQLLNEHRELWQENPKVLALLYLQHAYQSGDPDRLAEVLTLEIVEKPLKASGYKYLMSYFSDIGDSLAVMKYFQYYLLADNQPSSFEDLMQQRRE
ncbi:tetratricopeptide repeat protein [Tumebacillus permanentifrigoris]|uniref:HTH cro/C1-type domain-containing protein n=1 Tax=Tumebacillus permanentifrigoris TaxID=378543 RepID=A0A316D7D2_9BACL|nr:helix-turn-helix transcriptional regulator [Tumebacillus permanentifrigoris]PWK11567.1 hypothetical protein C7459_11096 [Tumebacillus permanentifrigoris]